MKAVVFILVFVLFLCVVYFVWREVFQRNQWLSNWFSRLVASAFVSVIAIVVIISLLSGL